MNKDITFCVNDSCTNRSCTRHPANITGSHDLHSFAVFDNCEYWYKEKYMQEAYNFFKKVGEHN